MKSYLYHVQIYINWNNRQFYKDLMEFLGWSVFHEEEWETGYRSGQDGDLWIAAAEKEGRAEDYDKVGVNHLAFAVDKMSDVDSVGEFLKKRGISILFDTPRHRPEFASEGKTYYQLDFETPDRLLFEIVYIGPKE